MQTKIFANKKDPFFLFASFWLLNFSFWVKDMIQREKCKKKSKKSLLFMSEYFLFVLKALTTVEIFVL